MGEAAPNQNDTNFWEVQVDNVTGKPNSKPRRITNWAGSSQSNLRATADGKHLVFLKQVNHSSVYVGELEENGTRMKGPRRLTLSEDNNSPAGWTFDSRAILFSSDRNGRSEIFKQALDEESAEPMVTDVKNNLYAPRLSPDGSWVLYIAEPKVEGGVGTSTPVNLMRLPVMPGGLPQVVLTSRGYAGHRCARPPATLCVLGEQNADRKQLAFLAFDPVIGRGREIMRIETDPNAEYSWDVSTDGSRLAVQRNGESEGHIRILPIGAGSSRDVKVKKWGHLTSLDWARDGRGFFASSDSRKGATLLHIDLEGNVHVLWVREGGVGAWGVPSPDGKNLAVSYNVVDINAWVIENF